MTGWDDDALADLRHHWGGAYVIHRLGDLWVAQRRDSRDSVSAESADGLREMIVADYTARPVPRDESGR